MTAATAPVTLETFLQPAAGLVTQVTDPNTGKETYAFPLQTSAWLKMQNVVRTALAFPLTQADFTSSYGTFSDEGTVETALAILGAINTTAQGYGDPQTLISQIAAFQKAAAAPDTIYANAVWLAAQTQTSAQQIQNLLKEGLTDIGNEPDPKVRLEDLTELLAGTGGITSMATTLNGEIGDFQTKTSTFYTTLNTQLNGPSNSLTWYLNQSSNVLSDAEQAVKDDKAAIHQMNDTIKTLNDEYIGFTVAASVSPLLLLIPFFGPVIAVADATTFAILAAKVKKQLDALRDALSKEEAAEQQKAALVTQIDQFNKQAADVETDGTDFLNAIATLAGGWAGFETQINTQLTSLTVADVEDWSAFMQKVNFQASLDAWGVIASTAETFFETGFAKFTQQDSL